MTILSKLKNFTENPLYAEWNIVFLIEEETLTQHIKNSINNFIYRKSNKELQNYIFYLYTIYNEIFPLNSNHPKIIYNQLILDIHKYILYDITFKIVDNSLYNETLLYTEETFLYKDLINL